MNEAELRNALQEWPNCPAKYAIREHLEKVDACMLGLHRKINKLEAALDIESSLPGKLRQPIDLTAERTGFKVSTEPWHCRLRGGPYDGQQVVFRGADIVPQQIKLDDHCYQLDVSLDSTDEFIYLT